MNERLCGLYSINPRDSDKEETTLTLLSRMGLQKRTIVYIPTSFSGSCIVTDPVYYP